MIEQVLTVLGAFFGVMLGMLPYVISITKNITLLTEKQTENDKEHERLWCAINKESVSK